MNKRKTILQEVVSLRDWYLSLLLKHLRKFSQGGVGDSAGHRQEKLLFLRDTYQLEPRFSCVLKLLWSSFT